MIIKYLKKRITHVFALGFIFIVSIFTTTTFNNEHVASPAYADIPDPGCGDSGSSTDAI